MTKEYLIAFFKKETERGLKRIEKLQLKEPTESNRKHLQGWQHHVDVCIFTLEHLEPSPHQLTN